MTTFEPSKPIMRDPSFRDLFTPKLVTILREGYTRSALAADLMAGLTVAIVALPLSMAIAIASGATPERGLIAAIIGGFLISALGGSRFQIGGPAGAFIVLVSVSFAEHGVEGTLLATMIAGVILIAIGLLQLGTFIKFIPYPVTVGFTAGIAVIILASQVRELFGLQLAGPEPPEIFPKLLALGEAAGTFDPAAAAISGLSIAIIVALRIWRPGWPGILIAVISCAVATSAFDLPIATIGSRFGGLPQSLPVPSLPSFSWAQVSAVFPTAIAFALLGAIESLLSAVVADGMTGRRHRSNCELVAQGVANIGSALFGGLVVTGAIARTATNVRAGAHGPVSGMAHAVYILGFMLIAAPLAAYIPLAALAGVLVIVAWNMAERHAFVTLLKASRGDALVLLATFLLTVFRDLTEAIVVGFLLGAVLFIHRMSQSVGVDAQTPFAEPDRPDHSLGPRTAYDPSGARDPYIVVYRISGAFFFGAASTVAAVLDRIQASHKAFIIDFAAVPFLDSTAAHVLSDAIAKAERQGVRVLLTAVSDTVARTLAAQGVCPPRVMVYASIDEALKACSGKVDAGFPSGHA
ncbi:MAG TPA: sodium-independent anion transporter [Alphaproteobacteria bacterium]|nr:sodium-independent anion transporter [Alphaproteobacteria bacterium]